MKKLKILIRLIMIIFMFSLPVYQLRELRGQYLEERRADHERSERLLEDIRENFLVRREDFYKDSAYKKEFKKLQEKRK